MSSKQIHHPSFGQGSVLVDNGATLVVRFEHGIEEVLASEIRTTVTAEAALEEMSLGSPVEAVARVQAAAISSLNDAWGVFFQIEDFAAPSPTMGLSPCLAGVAGTTADR